MCSQTRWNRTFGLPKSNGVHMQHIPMGNDCPSGPSSGHLLDICKSEDSLKEAMPHLQHCYRTLMNRGAGVSVIELPMSVEFDIASVLLPLVACYLDLSRMVLSLTLNANFPDPVKYIDRLKSSKLVYEYNRKFCGSRQAPVATCPRSILCTYRARILAIILGLHDGVYRTGMKECLEEKRT